MCICRQQACGCCPQHVTALRYVHFQAAETIRKSDVQKAVKAADMEWADTAYNRVMKALGRNAGGSWMLQDGELD